MVVEGEDVEDCESVLVVHGDTDCVGVMEVVVEPVSDALSQFDADGDKVVLGLWLWLTVELAVPEGHWVTVGDDV